VKPGVLAIGDAMKPSSEIDKPIITVAIAQSFR
jgi:hypothetical protein